MLWDTVTGPWRRDLQTPDQLSSRRDVLLRSGHSGRVSLGTSGLVLPAETQEGQKGNKGREKSLVTRVGRLRSSTHTETRNETGKQIKRDLSSETDVEADSGRV